MDAKERLHDGQELLGIIWRRHIGVRALLQSPDFVTRLLIRGRDLEHHGGRRSWIRSKTPQYLHSVEARQLHVKAHEVRSVTLGHFKGLHAVCRLLDDVSSPAQQAGLDVPTRFIVIYIEDHDRTR